MRACVSGIAAEQLYTEVYQQIECLSIRMHMYTRMMGTLSPPPRGTEPKHVYREWHEAWVVLAVNFFFSATFSVLNATIPDIAREFDESVCASSTIELSAAWGICSCAHASTVT